MNLSAPALTKSLQRLEQEFGASLVSRSPNGVRLTAAGELVAARADVALREITRAQEEVDWLSLQGSVNLTLAVSPAAAMYVLPGALARLRSRWSNVCIRVVEVVYPRSLTLLRMGEVDIAIGPMPKGGVGRDLCQQSLFSVQQVIIARAGHPLAASKRLHEIQHETWINSSPPGGPGDPSNLRLGERGLRSPLGLILGAPLEENFRRAVLIFKGDFGVFIDRPISGTALAFAGLLAVWSIWSFLRSRERTATVSSK